MQISRREFIPVIAATAIEDRIIGAPQAGAGRIPWYRKMRRCGQINYNYRDPLVLDIGYWIDYWSSLKVDAVLLNAGGGVCFYPTKIPYHHKSEFLGNRDLFGDFAKAAKKAGIRVVARLDCNFAFEEAWKARPEWFMRNEKGEPVWRRDAPGLYSTCMFSTYFSEQMTSIIEEINDLYDVDGFFTNGWPGAGRRGPCYCASCNRLPARKGPAFHELHLARVLEIWKLWDGAARRKKWDSVYVGNLGGGIRASTNLKKLGEVAGWFNADHQGRNGDTPIWDCAQQGRVAQSIMEGGVITNVTGAWSTSRPMWRHVAKSPAETTMWLAQTTATGMVPWLHWLGGAPDDERWRETGRRFYQWLAKYEPHFVNRRSIANIGVVFSQRILGYEAPGGGDNTEFLQGLYYALLEGRLLFDFVHEDALDPLALKKYSVLLLPNVARLSDAQCQRLRDYVRSGGSLLATFETSRYTDAGERRNGLGIADILGVSVAGEVQGPTGNSFFARVESPHEILSGFEQTRLLPGAEYRLPVKAAGKLVLSVVPPYSSHPPETVYPKVPRTEEPAVVMTEKGTSRTIYFPGDIDRSCWRSGHTDLSRLLQNAVRWLARGSMPVTVSGDGMTEMVAWETEPGFALHVLNYNNPNMMRGWWRKNYPIGPQQVRFELPQGRRISRARLLRAEASLPFRQQGRTVEFIIPGVEDYEIAALE
ncbi:MAG: alpha-amylase family protein [Bryobacteraceae bacterium]